MLDHGRMVRSRYLDLLGFIRGGDPILQWRMPAWASSPILAKGISFMDDRLVGLYQTYHDCGKPHCREVDGEGRQHFPNHARVSMETWQACSDGSSESMLVSRLIGMDMDVHLLKREGVREFSQREEWAVLLATGLSELHANAEMFGGLASTAFKIKHRRLDRVGRLLTEGR